MNEPSIIITLRSIKNFRRSYSSSIDFFYAFAMIHFSLGAVQEGLIVIPNLDAFCRGEESGVAQKRYFANHLSAYTLNLFSVRFLASLSFEMTKQRYAPCAFATKFFPDLRF